jgi:hypothetical protein
MRDWCTITETAATTCHSNNLLYGVDMPSWPDDYFGEAIYCTYNTVNKRVLEHIMDYVDVYSIMTYNTTPSNVVARATGELTYAGTMSAATRPEVWVSVETHCGVGANISYCDTPGKNSKSAVYTDITTIISSLSSYPALTGLNIHDWAVTGWKELTPAASNTATPTCLLPVKLLYFDGERNNDVNCLYWEVADQVNFSHFEVEHSLDRISFETIATVGSSIQSKFEYSYYHTVSGSVISYYKLKLVDLDGTSQYSSIISVPSVEESNIYLTPSPATSIVNVVFPEQYELITTLLVVDMKGIELLEREVNTENERLISIDVSNFSPGVYYVKLKNRNSLSTPIKFIKL